MTPMLTSRVLALVLATFPVVHSRGADATRQHPHQGILQKYERQSPSSYGISVEGVPAERLRSGRPVLKIISLKSGFKRAVSIQDIPAPPEVVWSKIMDLDHYPQMVDGCAKCETYRREKSVGGKQRVWSEYRICAGPFAMEYFIEHTFEPAKNCMTFHLDYDRLSEFSDTVGYWYVEKLEGGWSRVYYSADSQLPSWVPGFAKDRLIGQALRQSTSWVDKYAQLAVGTSGASRPPLVLVLLRRLLVAAALVQAKVKMLPKLLPGIRLPPVVGRTADSALLALRGLLSRLKALRAS